MCFVYKSQIKFSFISIQDFSVVLILPVCIISNRTDLYSILYFFSLSSSLKIEYHMHFYPKHPKCWPKIFFPSWIFVIKKKKKTSLCYSGRSYGHMVTWAFYWKIFRLLRIDEPECFTCTTSSSETNFP